MSKIKATRPSLQRQENDTNNRTKKRIVTNRPNQKERELERKFIQSGSGSMSRRLLRRATAFQIWELSLVVKSARLVEFLTSAGKAFHRDIHLGKKL